MTSRKAQKRSSSKSSQAAIRKALKRGARRAFETLEDRRVMTVEAWSDGFYYPPDAIQRTLLPPTISAEQFDAISKVQFADSIVRTRGTGEGTQGATSLSEVEPNSQRFQAQFLPLGTGSAQFNNVSVLGTLPAVAGVFDEDYYAFDLKAGDILDASLNATRPNFDLSILDSAGVEIAVTLLPVGAATYPVSSPLGRAGAASGSIVIPADGRYFARVSQGDSPYTLSLRAFRNTFEAENIGTKQKIFLDFDGATIRRDIFGIPTAAGNARLSPLSSFLAGWGMTPADENMMIDKIIASFTRRFTGSLPANGNNGYFGSSGVAGEFDIEILNSRDHADPWGLPNVSRVIVGGTVAELLIPTIGIAESIDVGNFDREETAVSLLDGILPTFTLFPRAGTVPLSDFLADAIGIVTAHEAGHFFGAFHTDPTNANNQLMDRGGTLASFAGYLGVGRDGVYGTSDDVPALFGTDRYDSLTSPFAFGIQNTAAAVAAGLSTGTIGAYGNGTVFLDANLNRNRDGGEAGLSGLRVYADINGDGIYQSGEPQAITKGDGTYSLALTPGTYTVRQDVPVGFKITTPATNSHRITVANGTVVNNLNFGLERVDQTVTGFKFNDLNGNGFPDPGEPRMAGVWIWIDVDGDYRIDLGEPQVKTAADGSYSLKFPGVGLWGIRELIEPGYVQTLPGPSTGFRYVVEVTGNPAVDLPNMTGLNFGNQLFLDFGDAPNTYGTLSASDGARHGFIPGLILGANWDAEQNGQPSVTALGDDAVGALDSSDQVIDDEDGVLLARPISRSATNILSVTASTTAATAYLHGWIDLNGDGDFTDSGEKILSNHVVSSGTQTVTFPALGGARLGDTYMRVRLSQDRDLGPTGLSGSGEVEDYRISIVEAPQIALNDSFEVSRNSTLNSLDVVANDFKVPGETLTIVSQGPSRVGGIVQVTSDNKILYTPPNGFVGTDTFPYTVESATGETSTANVTVTVNLFFEDPKAIDDSFDVPTNAVSFPLNVLANDIEGRAGALSIISVTQPNLGGQISIATGGQSLRFTPPRDQGDTSQFTYTVADAAGKTSTATVTLHTLPGDQLNDDVLIRLVATDLSGNVITAVPQGQEFRIDVFVDDLRNDRSVPILVSSPGVFAAYLDLLYNLQLVTTVPSQAGSRFDFDVSFVNGYTNLQLGDASVPGIIDELGAFNTSFLMNQPNPVRMASIRFAARSPGLAVFKADPAEDPLADTVLFDTQNTPVPLERIRYVGTTLEIVGDSTEFPQAIDDSFTTNVPVGARNFPLQVLPNDRPGSTGVIRLFDVTQPTNGSVDINNNGTPNDPTDDRILYTPTASFTGTDTFTYTIQDSRAVQSTARVTVRVGSTTITDANDDVNLRLQLFKTDGTPLADGETLPVNSKFQLRGFVKDLRGPFDSGVFAAFQDIIYNSAIASVDPDTNNPLGFSIEFGPDYRRVQTGDVRVPGLINEVGSIQTGGTPLGDAERLLFTITLTANRVGTVSFIGDPADVLPLHDTLLFQPPTPVTADRIRYGFDSVTIVAGSGAGGEGFTNPNNAFDVNADGNVSAIDVLSVINLLNNGGSGTLNGGGEGEDANRLYVDVNGDGVLSPMDALLVINYLNGRGVGAGEGEAAPVVVLSNRVIDALDNLASSGVDIGPNATALIAAQSNAPIVGDLALDWTLPGSEEGESLDDLLGELAPEIDTVWKRK
ncbi:MAG: cadherin-like domain-containing protein [Pirellulaceae bacterium]|nr:cadherin-like domain-containing protein [Pirellulaceae bacterium]